MKHWKISVLCSLFFSVAAIATPRPLMQQAPGFVGYIPAGLEFQIYKVSLNTNTLMVSVPEDPAAGHLQVTFKNFERALGGGKKVEYINKKEPLQGRSFVLKNNLILLPVK